MKRFSRAQAARDERGAAIILLAVAMAMLMVFVALAVDISTLVNDKQNLHDALDTAAHAGAYKLPDDAAGARADALAFVQTNFPGAPTPTIDLWCVVGASPGPVVNTTHIPATCYPGPGPYDSATYSGLMCNDTICAIPCSGDPGTKCNTIRVGDQKDVPYSFAPVIGINQGSTGPLVSAACKGACGTQAPAPIDFAMVADRTGSMSGYYDELGAGMQELLKALDPAYHSVALGTISMSSTTAPSSCPTRANPSVQSGGHWVSSGTWMPVGFSSDYQVTPATSPPTLNVNSALVKGVNCIAGGDSSGTGTWLAAPLKAAADYLVANGRATANKAMIFETDGEPNESNVTDVPYGSSNGNTACTNAQTQATNAKSAGILVVTIAFRLVGTRCDGSTSGSSPTVTSVLASMASPEAPGVPSADDGGGLGAGCNTAAKVSAENTDGDYFFCTSGTPSATDLQAIYRTAAIQLNTGIKLLSLP
jgi:hypothetical protein